MMVPNLTSTGSGGGIPGPRGPAGADGKSAYEVAVDNGFLGTAAEWIASLEGDPGAPGSPGTDGAPGDDGVDGKSVELQKSVSAIQWRQTDGEWLDLVTLDEITGPPGSGGEGWITSVNGQTGPDVVLGAADVGAAPATDLVDLSGLLTDLETAVSALDTAIDGKQDADGSLSAIAAFSTAGSLQTRTARLNFPTSGGGAVYAFGRNGRNTGGQMQGLQVGGGVESDGVHGVYMAPDGHGSWMRLQPSRNY